SSTKNAPTRTPAWPDPPSAPASKAGASPPSRKRFGHRKGRGGSLTRRRDLRARPARPEVAARQGAVHAVARDRAVARSEAIDDRRQGPLPAPELERGRPRHALSSATRCVPHRDVA